MLSEFEGMRLGLWAAWQTLEPGAGVSAALLLAAVWGVGWLVARLAGRPLEATAARAAPNLIGGFSGRLCPIFRELTAALLLWALVAAQPLNGDGIVILAAGLAAAIALLGYHVMRGVKLSQTPALLLAALLFALILAGTLGGLAPVATTLAAASLPLGQRHITLLDIINTALVAGVLLVLVRAASRIAARWIGSATALDLSQRVLFQKLAQIAVVTVAFFIGIDLAGIDLTALTVFSGAFGLAVGFGLQKTFGNLIAGLILLMDRSIKPGDVIAIGDTFGWVNKIGVRYVSLLTRDGKEHLIPNEKLMTEPVENWSYSSRDVRIHIPVPVAHGCDIKLAQALMVQAANETERVLTDPAPVAWLTRFGSSALEHDLRVWIDDPEKGVGNVQSAIMVRIWVLFREHGINFPHQQHDVYLRNVAEHAG